MKNIFVLKVNAVTASLFTSQVMEKKADDVEQTAETENNKEDSKGDQVSFPCLKADFHFVDFPIGQETFC